MVVYEEVNKLKEASFICEIKYHKWVSNIVMVKSLQENE